MALLVVVATLGGHAAAAAAGGGGGGGGAVVGGGGAAAAGPFTLSDSKLSATLRGDGALMELKVPGRETVLDKERVGR